MSYADYLDGSYIAQGGQMVDVFVKEDIGRIFELPAGESVLSLTVDTTKLLGGVGTLDATSSLGALDLTVNKGTLRLLWII